MASLPSISPAWMPLWMRITGLPSRRAASGVKAPSAERTTSGSGRPAAEAPKVVSRIRAGIAFSSRRRKSSVSS